jgi:drug/metabolite transporter (DMT)-like permease
VRWFALAAVLLLVAGAALLALGYAGDHAAAKVLGIVAAVLGLACWRVTSWARKVRALTAVGLDLAHKPDDPVS